MAVLKEVIKAAILQYKQNATVAANQPNANALTVQTDSADELAEVIKDAILSLEITITAIDAEARPIVIQNITLT